MEAVATSEAVFFYLFLISITFLGAHEGFGIWDALLALIKNLCYRRACVYSYSQKSFS
jgi:hypothetical protein